MPAGYFCRINEGPSFGFPHTTNIISPGWFLGSTGFHGMASLVVKVPWVAPAFAPAAGGAPVARVCAFIFASCCRSFSDFFTAVFAIFPVNFRIMILRCLLINSLFWQLNRSMVRYYRTIGAPFAVKSVLYLHRQ